MRKVLWMTMALICFSWGLVGLMLPVLHGWIYLVFGLFCLEKGSPLIHAKIARTRLGKFATRMAKVGLSIKFKIFFAISTLIYCVFLLVSPFILASLSHNTTLPAIIAETYKSMTDIVPEFFFSPIMVFIYQAINIIPLLACAIYIFVALPTKKS